MTREEIIQGLQFTIDMFLLNPTTGETYTEPINDMDKTTIDACKGAIKLLKEESEKDEVILTKKEYGELVSSEFDNGYAKGFREALEQEPCEDAVSRQAVLDVDFKRIVLTTAKPAETIRQKIQELPSVTPVRKKGKWIRVDHNKVKCSECEITHLIAQYPHGAINFCPNCGAKNCPLVEIATCKDCKYYYPDEDGRGYHCERDSHVRFSVYRDFYCADAERRK